MEFGNYNSLEKATKGSRENFAKLGITIIFMAMIIMYVSTIKVSGANSIMLIIAAIFGGYMAMNIGANDVANNVGPAVGSKALTLVGAIIIAAIFEAAGAIIAGGDVVSTIKNGIIDPSLIKDSGTFVWIMMAAILAGALWLNLATAFGAPVSTTHSIVGGVLGSGIAAGGFAIANWKTMGAIVSSWVISPLLGGIIAALFLYFIKRSVIFQKDMVVAAQKVVPILVSIMVWAFSTYILLKGLKHIIKFSVTQASLIGLCCAVIVYFILIPVVKKATEKLSNTRDDIKKLFTIPLIFSAALLSFAHGANDVANAIGPLAAINDAIVHGGIVKKATIPTWVLLIGALGLSLGLSLYGPKLIKTVGSEITELDQVRAFCVAMSAALTVIFATQLGLPVSSTHIAVGGIFGVGFLREYLRANYEKMEQEIIDAHPHESQEKIDEYLKKFKVATVFEKEVMMNKIKNKKLALQNELDLTKYERKIIKKAYKEEIVKRSVIKKIIAAWIITVPATAVLSAMIFFMIKGMMIE